MRLGTGVSIISIEDVSCFLKEMYGSVGIWLSIGLIGFLRRKLILLSV